MRKLVISAAMLAMLIGLAVAIAQDSPPPMGPPPPGWGPPPPGTMGGPAEPGMAIGMRREMWEKFQREHPEDAKTLKDMIEKYPEWRMILGIGRGGKMMEPPGVGPGMPGRMGPRMERKAGEHFDRIEKIMSLREQAFALADKYNQATSAQEKKKIETDLRKLLGNIYELRLADMKDHVSGAEKMLGRVKEDLSRYEKDRNGVIESWFKKLTGREEYKEF
jgi:hypothetical protein